MQSVSELGKAGETNLVTAEALLEMTISPQNLFEKQKTELLDNFMSSMVRIATEQGLKQYAANLHPQFDVPLLAAVKSELQTLGYLITTANVNSPTAGDFIQLQISWDKNVPN